MGVGGIDDDKAKKNEEGDNGDKELWITDDDFRERENRA